MKQLTIKGVPQSLRNDAWWLDGTVIKATALDKGRVVLDQDKGSKP